MKVPLVPFNAYARFANEGALYQDKEDWDDETFEVNEVVHGKYLLFEVKGDSMGDGTRQSFEEGDKVLVRELGREHWREKLRYNKYPFWVVAFDNSVLLKQVIDHATGLLRSIR